MRSATCCSRRHGSGPERIGGAYAWRKVLDAGAMIAGGTDAPVEAGDPRVEFYAAIARRTLEGFAGPDWGLDQRLTREEALAILTRNAAYAAFEEKRPRHASSPASSPTSACFRRTG